MSVLAAAVCPHPPLLVPAIAAGAAPELDSLRGSCRAAVDSLMATAPDVVVVVGDGPSTGEFDQRTSGSLRGFGIDVTVGGDATFTAIGSVLPLAHTIGAWLLDDLGWAGRRRYVAVSSSTSSTDASALGDRLANSPDRVALLVMGDGSARRSDTAPGYLDDRAERFDAAVVAALGAADTVDTAALVALDAQLAVELLVAGRASWQVLAGAIEAEQARTGVCWTGDMLADVAPYGVGYFVTTAKPGPSTS